MPLELKTTFSDAEKKALEWDIVDLQEWFDNFLHHKASRCIDRIVLEHSDKQPSKLTLAEKEQIVLNTPLKTAAERQAELEAREL